MQRWYCNRELELYSIIDQAFLRALGCMPPIPCGISINMEPICPSIQEFVFHAPRFLSQNLFEFLEILRVVGVEFVDGCVKGDSAPFLPFLSQFNDFLFLLINSGFKILDSLF